MMEFFLQTIYFFLWGYLFSCAISFADALAERILNAHYRKSRKTIKDKFRYTWGDRSRCDSCQKAIAPHHVLPIFGILLSQARCPACGHQISRRYFYREVAAFLYGTVLAVLFEDPIYLGFSAAYMAIGLVIARVDGEFFLIPLEATFAILLLGFTEMAIGKPQMSEVVMSLAVALIWFSLLLLLYYLYKNRLGLGDLYLVFAMGIALGFPRSLYLPTLASLIAIFRYALHFKNRASFFQTKVPFGVYLWLAFLVLRMFPSKILF